MSVTFHLYRPNYAVEYRGTIFERSKVDVFNSTNESKFWEIYKSAGYKEGMSAGELVEIDEKIDAKAWSDGVKHEQLNINYIRGQFQLTNKKYHRALRRNMKRLKTFQKKRYTTGYGVTTVYIPVDEIMYDQGWFLKHKFFKRKVWTVICTTKKQLKKFAENYATKEGLRRIQAFIDNWEDGMIFRCSW